MRSMLVVLLTAVVVAAAAPAFSTEDFYAGKLLTTYTTQKYTDLGDRMAAQFLPVGSNNPVWSPDGKTIYFACYGGYGIWSVPAEGGEATLLLNINKQTAEFPDAKYNCDMEPLCLTPDAKELMFLEYVFDAERGSYVKETETGMSVYHLIPTIRCLDLTTGKVRNLVDEAVDGSWSPDGRYFVYSWQASGEDFGKKWGVKVLDTQTGENKLLLLWGYSPAVTPDGKYVVYSSQSAATGGTFSTYGKPYNLYRIPITGGEAEQYTFFTMESECCNPFAPAFSPNGEWLTFQAWYLDSPEARQVGLCVMNLKTGETFKAFPRAEVSTKQVRWSYDSTKIAFVTGSSRGADGHIYTVAFQPTPFWKPTAVEETTPLAFGLTGNYPNPFNPSTTISFSLPSAGPVSLTVYDITGRKVRELASGPMSAGSHSVVWDGRDDRGTAVSSGVYLSRLTMGSRTSANRMLLAK